MNAALRSPARPARLATAVLLAALASSAARVVAAPGPVPDGLAGLWRVADSACSGCDPSQGPEAGGPVRITPRGMQNPFGADCDGLLEAEALPPESVDSVVQRLGLPARWLGGAEVAPAQPYRLVCGGQARETVILLANGALLMPGEASNVLRLLRAP